MKTSVTFGDIRLHADVETNETIPFGQFDFRLTPCITENSSGDTWFAPCPISPLISQSQSQTKPRLLLTCTARLLGVLIHRFSLACLGVGPPIRPHPNRTARRDRLAAARRADRRARCGRRGSQAKFATSSPAWPLARRPNTTLTAGSAPWKCPRAPRWKRWRSPRRSFRVRRSSVGWGDGDRWNWSLLVFPHLSGEGADHSK